MTAGLDSEPFWTGTTNGGEQHTPACALLGEPWANAWSSNSRSAYAVVGDPTVTTPLWLGTAGSTTVSCDTQLSVLCACAGNVNVTVVNRHTFPPTESPTAAPTPYAESCFAASSTVELRGGERRRLDAVRIGEEVLVGDPATARSYYEKVLAFMHVERNTTVELARIDVEGMPSALRLSTDHLVFVGKAATGPFTDLRAEQIVPGDYVLVRGAASAADGEGAPLAPARVLRVSVETDKGFVTPLTESGTTIVDGVLASNHILVSHAYVQALMSPVRWWYRTFGLANEGQLGAEGLHPYVQRILDVRTVVGRRGVTALCDSFVTAATTFGAGVQTLQTLISPSA